MNQRNLIIGAIVIVGGYLIYKKYYTKPTTTTTSTTKPKLPSTEPIVDKGEPIAPTSSTTSSFDEGL